MEHLTLWQMSVTGGVMILFIVLVRALFLHRLPKKAFPVLWGLCLLRLMLPVSVPSVLSVYNLAGGAGTGRGLAPETILPVAVSKAPAAAALAETSAQNAAAVSSVSFWAVLWAIGAVLCAAVFLLVYIRCRLQFRESIPVSDPFVADWMKNHPLRRKMEIRQSGYISTPLTYGIFRPVILLSRGTDWEDREGLAFILEHEYTHIRRFDAAMKLLYTLAACVHWFNPLVWVMLVLVNRDMELACDETVVRVLGTEKKKTYARMLIDLEEKGAPAPFSSSFSKNAVEERIVAIMKVKKKSLLAVMLAAGLIIGTGAVLGTSAYADQKTYNIDSPAPDSAPAPVPEEEYFAEYQKLGLEIVGEKQIFYYDGQEVRYFLDGIEREGNVIAQYTYFNGEGTIDIHTVWEEKDNGDGSVDPMYRRLRIEPYSQEEFDARDIGALTEEFEGTWVAQSDEIAEGSGGKDAIFAEDARLQAEAALDWEETLAPYLPFGLTYQYDAETLQMNSVYGLTMWYQGREVRGIVDETTGTWITEHAGDSDFSADAAEVYVVYTDGKMSGLRFADQEEQKYWDDVRRKNRESVYEVSETISTAVARSSAGWEEGETIAERFEKYRPFGITYEETSGSLGNVYLNGERVRVFVDEGNKGVFSFQSLDGGEIDVYMVYDADGNLTGVRSE